MSLKSEAQKYLDELITIFEFIEEDNLIEENDMEQARSAWQVIDHILRDKIKEE